MLFSSAVFLVKISKPWQDIR